MVRSENEAGLVLGDPNERFVHTLEESYRDTQLGLEFVAIGFYDASGAPFCDAVGLPEMRDTVPAGNEEMIRKVKSHMLTKTRDDWLAMIPKEISVVPMLEFDEVLGADMKDPHDSEFRRRWPQRVRISRAASSAK